MIFLRSYKGSNIKEIIDNSPYEWRATGTYGVERLSIDTTDIFMIYVKNSDLIKWDSYLSDNNIVSTDRLPDLKLIGVDKLPKSHENDKHLVEIIKLIEDLFKMAPRYAENHPEVVERLKKLS